MLYWIVILVYLIQNIKKRPLGFKYQTVCYIIESKINSLCIPHKGPANPCGACVKQAKGNITREVFVFLGVLPLLSFFF